MKVRTFVNLANLRM